MLKHIKRSLSLAVVLLLVSSSVSMALPIEPIGSERLDYLELIMDVIEEYYVEEIDSDILVEGAFRGVFDQLDQYSAYFFHQRSSKDITKTQVEHLVELASL